MKAPRFPADHTEEIMNMEYPFCSTTEFTTTTTRRSKRKNKNKRRFSNDQIRSLESIFESESRLHPRKKYQVAKDLGLQPRQLQKLNNLLKKPKEEEQCIGQVDDKLSFSMERSEHAVGVLSDDDSGYFILEEEPELISIVEPADGALTSPEDWHGFESDALFDPSGSGYQWWDFWS
ncbi:hypothetical protein F3Y22_tig00110549pilonHSYRG00043 [Hibiscus syriacus]|uniref:Homeobox-leucine zipper protein n=1 Tax=Hibiscus syriacus TaxID=106335 RepID=A0A6A3A937_HIBSY|nr:hypothetical protein F3Y22_tig00110549pilonHSYRG00043 [Hibiscus syriacus]